MVIGGNSGDWMYLLHTEKYMRLDTNMVQVIADEMKFYELVVFIEEHKGDYAKFILTGEC